MPGINTVLLPLQPPLELFFLINLLVLHFALSFVLQLANYLKDIGVKKGDAVVIYLPMLMELPIAMLACARIGAVHSVT